MVDEDLGVREGGSVAVMNDELVALYPIHLFAWVMSRCAHIPCLLLLLSRSALHISGCRCLTGAPPNGAILTIFMFFIAFLDNA